jgi:hypothetical protein
MIQLGKLVRDKVSGMSGIATSRTTFLNGCIRIAVQPKIDKDEKLPDEKWFDEDQIEIIGEGISMPEKKVGGPNSNCPPSQQR